MASDAEEWEYLAPERTGGPIPVREMHENYLQHLAGLRRYFGVTQEDLSNNVEVSASTIGSWERGQSSPTVKQLQAWARSLGMHLEINLVPIREETSDEPGE